MNTMRGGTFHLAVLLSLFLGLAGCGAKQDVHFADPFFADNLKSHERAENAAKIKQIFGQIDERNNTRKRSPEWLKKAYAGLGIKKLNDIPKELYGQYSKYADRGEVYCIVHPGYFGFFTDTTELPVKDGELVGGMPLLNHVERLGRHLPREVLSNSIVLEQERILRDFLEYMAAEQKLVILVLPSDYAKHYRYRNGTGLDEYVRYLNDVTNMSSSIIYIESMTYDTGYIRQADLDMLDVFFKANGIKTIYFGGGYLGKCVDAFYASMRKKYSYDNLLFVPELAMIAPWEASHSELYTSADRINVNWVVKYLKKYDSETGRDPKIKRLPLYRIYANRENLAPKVK